MSTHIINGATQGEIIFMLSVGCLQSSKFPYDHWFVHRLLNHFSWCAVPSFTFFFFFYLLVHLKVSREVKCQKTNYIEDFIDTVAPM